MKRRYASCGVLLAVIFVTAAVTFDASANEDEAEEPALLLLDESPAAMGQRIIRELQSPDMDIRAHACRELAFSGLNDRAIFDPIEVMVQRDYALTLEQGTLVKEVPSCVRALASAGNAKYRETVEQSITVEPERGFGYGYARNHMQRSIELMRSFTRWNAIIASTLDHRPGQHWTELRALNMLRSGDAQLRREGLKRLKPMARQNPELYEDIERELLRDAAQPFEDPRVDDFTAYLCKALGESANPAYAPAVERLLKAKPHPKILRHCTPVLEGLRDAG